MFVLKTKEEPNPPSNHSFDPPFVHPHFFTGLTWERKVQMFEWMRGGGPRRVQAHTIQLKELWKNNMWDSDKYLLHLSYQMMLKPMSTASKDLVLLKQTDYTMTDKCQITQRCRQRRRCRRSRRRWRRRPGTSGKTFSGTEAGRSSFGWTGLLKNWECLYKKYESPMEGKSKEGFSMAGQTFFGPCRQIDLVKKHWLCVLISHRVYIVYKPV